MTLSGNEITCTDTGAMTAIATCSGGAIASSGALTLGGGTVIANNSVAANAEAATYTTAWAGGGRRALVRHDDNRRAGDFHRERGERGGNLGYHDEPFGGAEASAAGGAIYNTGTLSVTAAAGSCQFTGQRGRTPRARRCRAPPPSPVEAGAIENLGTLLLPPGACRFTTNSAQTGADIDSPNLLAGPWQFVSSDVSRATHIRSTATRSTSTSKGIFTYPASGYQGYTFQQSVPLVLGATYVLTVNVTNATHRFRP